MPLTNIMLLLRTVSKHQKAIISNPAGTLPFVHRHPCLVPPMAAQSLKEILISIVWKPYLFGMKSR